MDRADNKRSSTLAHLDDLITDLESLEKEQAASRTGQSDARIEVIYRQALHRELRESGPSSRNIKTDDAQASRIREFAEKLRQDRCRTNHYRNEAIESCIANIWKDHYSGQVFDKLRLLSVDVPTYIDLPSNATPQKLMDTGLKEFLAVMDSPEESGAKNLQKILFSKSQLPEDKQVRCIETMVRFIYAYRATDAKSQQELVYNPPPEIRQFAESWMTAMADKATQAALLNLPGGGQAINRLARQIAPPAPKSPPPPPPGQASDKATLRNSAGVKNRALQQTGGLAATSPYPPATSASRPRRRSDAVGPPPPKDAPPPPPPKDAPPPLPSASKEI
jgi:hypothetical protein